MNSKNMMLKSAKIAAIAVMASTIVLGSKFTVSAAGNSEHQGDTIPTVYHIYVGNNSIGTVNDKSLISDIKNKMISKAEKADPKNSYVMGENISIIPEKTFDPEYNNDKTIKAFKDKTSVMPHAIAINLDGKPVIYVKTREEAEKVLHNFKLQFVSEDVLDELAIKKASIHIVPLGLTSHKPKTDPGLLDANLNKDVSVTDSKVADPDGLLTVEEAVKRLSHGDLVKDQYKVEEGNTLSDIAQKFDLSLDELLKLNPKLNENSLMHIGDTVTVKKPEPYLKLVVSKNVTKKEEIKYKKVVKTTDDMYKGQSKTVQNGKNGEKKVQYHLTLENGKVVHRDVLNQDVLKKPQEEIIKKGTKVIPSRGTGELRWPAGGGITSPFGYRWGELHKGIDISRSGGRTVVAADNGVVVSAGWDDGGYGNRIVINHHDGMKTTYNHLSAIKVHVGQVVRKGEQIGVMGSTGDSTGVHLHFEVYENGHLVNPINVLP